jgi:hypothetical protein
MTAVDVGNTIGALHCGLAISLFLFGVVTLQVYFYFEHYPEDVRALKALVCCLPLARICSYSHLQVIALWHVFGYRLQFKYSH